MEKPNARWYDFTLLRLLLPLAVIEACLLFLQKCRWFGLIEHEGNLDGLTFFIGFMAVLGAGALAIVWLLLAFGIRRRFQYSLRSLLLLTLFVAICMSCVATVRQWAQKQRKAAAALKDAGCDVRWDNGAIKEGVLSEATHVSFNGIHVTDSALQHIKDLTRLRWLEFEHTDVTDKQLECVEDCTRLDWLDLEGTQVTDVALEHVGKVSQLAGVNLRSTRISNTGLEHLENLRYLTGLYIANTPITDDGLETLARMPQLLWLDLTNTKVTEEGMAKLRRALPRCQITR